MQQRSNLCECGDCRRFETLGIIFEHYRSIYKLLELEFVCHKIRNSNSSHATEEHIAFVNMARKNRSVTV